MEELRDQIQSKIGEKEEEFEKQERILKSSDGNEVENKEEEIPSEIRKLNSELNQLSVSLNINEIPLEVLALIFEALETSTKLRCRSVCRKWNEIVKNLPGSESLLIVDEQMHEEYLCDFRWFEQGV